MQLCTGAPSAEPLSREAAGGRARRETAALGRRGRAYGHGHAGQGRHLRPQSAKATSQGQTGAEGATLERHPQFR